MIYEVKETCVDVGGLKNVVTSRLWIWVSAGFRSPASGRMAVWLWLRCVFGPRLQRIHRSPEQPPTEAGRRVWLFTYLYLLPNTTVCENVDSVASLDVAVAPEVSGVLLGCSCIHRGLRWINEWKGAATIIRVSFNGNRRFNFPPHSSKTAAFILTRRR